MPLFRGATSKIILAHLPPRDLRRLYEIHRAQIGAAKLGDAWEAFRSNMTRMRKAGHAVTHAEVDPECIGIAMPILDDHRRVLGSLSYVIPVSEERAVARLASLAATGAREIEEGMRADFGVPKHAVREEAAGLSHMDFQAGAPTRRPQILKALVNFEPG